MDFNKLKKSRGDSLKAMTKKLEEMNASGGGQKDSRIWKPAFDKKEGKGLSVVRFLPSQHSDNGIHFQKVHHHYFKGRNGWYIENSLKTIGETDPADQSFWLHWNKSQETGDDSYKNKVINGQRGDKQKFYANVLIIKDSENPENEGQVKIFEFGPGIFKIIEDAMKPEFEDVDEPIDPFDMWEGANLRIKAIGNEIPDRRNPGKKTMVPKYDKSEFESVSELFEDDDDKKKEVFEKTYDLSEFAKVKTFKELADRFEKVTGEAWDYLEQGDAVDDEIRKLEEQSNLKTSDTDYDPDEDDLPDKNPSDTDPEDPPFDTDDDEDDDALAKFKKMAGG